MLNDFMNNAKGLTRNPLGIIALFVSLIYGFACLVLSTSISNLNNYEERLPLIWFIILFPLIILMAFIYLVVNHHEKLYAPSDFRGDESFIQIIDENKRKLKINKEVENLESSPKSDIIDIEEEKPKKENASVKTSNNTSKVVPAQEPLSKVNLLEIYSNSETWATNELSLKYKVSFSRNVTIQVQSSKFELDAYSHSQEKTYIVEVKYWKYNRSNKRLKLAIQEFLAKQSKFKMAFKNSKKIKVIIAIVYDNLEKVNKKELEEFVQNIGNEDVVLELFDYNNLKVNYE